MSDKPLVDKIEDAISRRVLEALEEPGDEGVSAAMLQAAMKWHERIKLGKTGDDPEDPVAAAMEAIERAQNNGGSMPDLDLEGDDSTA